MHRSRYIYWLPNILSGSRVVFAAFIYTSALQQAWIVCFWLLVAALATDFFDGLAAKKLHAESTLGGHIDRVADFSLALAGMLGLVRGAHLFPMWLIYVGLIVAAYVGYIKFFVAEETLIRRITSIISLLLLFFAWIFVAWGFLTQAFGWSWLYPLITFILLVAAASFKRHRLRAWFGWLVAHPKMETKKAKR